jgi:hypothetical protein
MNKKTGNIKQIKSVYEIEFVSGRERGKQALLVNCGNLELLISKDNAMDILWLRHCGVNMSFLSKNGINTLQGDFEKRFEGGFLYTCGFDNISSCVKGRPIHGCLHSTAAENIDYEFNENGIEIRGCVSDTALFRRNLVLYRKIIVKNDELGIFDTVNNAAYENGEYCLLYHFNLGYPFLDESMHLEFESVNSEGLTIKAHNNLGLAMKMEKPTDCREEEVFYHKLKTGSVKAVNSTLKKEMTMEFSLDNLPVFIEWKSMASGDYALGLEPSTSRFDNFEYKKIGSLENHCYHINFKFQ